MATPSTNSLVDCLRQNRLLDQRQLGELTADLRSHQSNPQALAKELLSRGWLTAYQANQLLQGRGDELVFGSYVVLERLGEGGMGQVFKAQHRSMQRLVALKVIRKDFIADPEVVGRFYREMQVSSRLAHPNVVNVYDAGPAGATHFLAMELIDGIDLHQLVERSGPLPVERACDYIRQAALGLQHIHEHGLVHRDIKPSNLLLAQAHGSQSIGSAGVVKILDLGLARFQEVIHGKTSTRLPDGVSVTTLTLDGPVTMGTIDYLSPEQALHFHQVDIRGDIYSLGCTLFYLLTGKPPFGNGPLAVKLMQHQQAEPPDVRHARPEVPVELSQLLRRMLAKRPEDRHQTPGDVAQALAGILRKTAAKQTTGFLRWVGAAAGALLLAGLLALVFIFAGSRDGGSARSTMLPKAVPTTAEMKVPASARGDSPPPTATTGTKVVTIRHSVADTLISPTYPDKKHGNVPDDNRIGNVNDAGIFLLRFDLQVAGLSKQSRVERATLTFYVWDPQDEGRLKLCAFLLKTPWEASSATWRQPAEGRQWQGGKTFVLRIDTGDAGPFIVVPPSPAGNDMVMNPPVEHTLAITNFVQSWAAGDLPNHGLALTVVRDAKIDNGQENRIQIFASEHSREQFRPRLTIHCQP